MEQRLGGDGAPTTDQVCGASPPAYVWVERLAPRHAADAARLHVDAQPGTFLTALGPEVLRIVYEKLPDTGVGFGFAVTASGCDDKQTASIGFVSATTSVATLFVQTGLTEARRLLPHLAARSIRSPALIGRTFQTAFYPFVDKDRHRDDDHEVGDGNSMVRAELLSIMIERHWRSRGIGSLLIGALLAECDARHIAHIDVTVDAANEGARRFYTRHGFELRGTFPLYGRHMCSYGRPVRQRRV